MAKTSKIKMTDLSKKNQRLSPEEMKKVTGGTGAGQDMTLSKKNKIPRRNMPVSDKND